ncbi:VMAP-C domain-containing protein [Streptomyces mirabilis]|uniref:VMAP-C domain-containing protein n=1 Tax=Streptomyces mirabilis TaxID=68239 RepID=UPI0036ACFBD8
MTGQLEQLAMRATVWIGPDTQPGLFWGSGFLVAPGWVLTCAHILPLAQGAENVGVLRVRGHGFDAGARLAYWLGGGTDPEQDLALVRLADGAAHGPVACVRLTDRYDPPHQVTAFGWRMPSGGAPQRWSGYSECNGRDGSYGLTLAPHMEIPHGASGGPLLDRDHGVVVGVVKARRKGQDGGLAVASTGLRGFRDARAVDGEDGLGPDPYTALIREHDRWHHRVTGGLSWVRLQGEPAAGGRRWAARDGAEASALLADLPPPVSSADLEQMISRVLGYEPLWEDALAPVDWRDGLGWVYDQPDGAEVVALHYLLAVAHACRRRAPDAVAELERWVKSRIEELPDFLAALLRERAPGDARRTPDDARFAAGSCGASVPDDEEERVVAVELEPEAYGPGDRFHWRVWSWPDRAGMPQVLAEDTGGEGSLLSELPQALDRPLRNAFRQLDAEQRRARLELALPVEHFGLDAHTWPRSAQTPFGAQRQVVLRSLKRRGEPADVWQQRWAGVTANALRALPVHSSEYAREALEEAEPGAVPVLCRPPRQSADSLTDAIGAGYSIALCSLRGEHARACGTDCGELYGRAVQLLGVADSAMALPELLRSLRERADAEGGNGEDSAWAARLALLYDDPRRPIPVSDDLLESP